MGIEKYLRPELATFGGYSAATAPETLEGKVEMPVTEIIKLDANENPYGCSPRVQEALRSVAFNIYPDNEQGRLRWQLSAYTGIDPRYIVAGNGSNQLIDLVFRLLLSKDDEIINLVPTFGIYSFSAQLCGGRLVEVRREEDFSVSIAKVKAAVSPRTKLICIANPNNPTGNVMPREDILSLLETGLPVLVDEAYYEFCGESVAGLVPVYDNLIVLRTFSKWAGLAGLRIGYGIFSPVLADYLLRTKIPYNVNVAALAAAEASFKDIDYLMTTVRAIVAERARLFDGLKKIEWLRPYPSQANFILCAVLRGKAKELHKRMEERGILLRYFDQPLLRDFIRISVGKPEHTDTLLRALREYSG